MTASTLVGTAIASGTRRQIEITGLDVTPSMDPDLYPLQRKRDVFLAYYWEDMARNDADGPTSDIE